MTISPDGRFLAAHPAHFIALGLGLGLSPFAPGTVGSLLGFPLFWLLDESTSSPQAFFGILFVLFFVGVWACGRTGRALGVADHGAIVWDEVVAFAGVLYFTPAEATWWASAFFVFRAFDVIKPFPIRGCDERLENGFGVMFDDVLAAVYTVLILMVFGWLLGRPWTS